MGKLIFGRLLSQAIWGGGLFLSGVRLALDLIGYSTAPEDIAVAQSRLDQFIGWLLGLPWWALLGFVLITTLWLMRVSWPRQQPAPPLTPSQLSAPPVQAPIPPTETTETKSIHVDKIESAEERQAKHELMVFANQYVLPAFDAQIILWKAILDRVIGEGTVLKTLAWKGLEASGSMPNILDRLERLRSIVGSSPAETALDELESIIHHLSKDYHSIASKPSWLCSKTKFNYMLEPTTRELTDKCRIAHDELTTNFLPLRRNPLLAKLYSVKSAGRIGSDFETDAFILS